MSAKPELPARRPIDETARLGQAIYERDIRALVEADHRDEYVSIDIASGAWALADSLRAACDDLREKHPDVVDVFTVRVGHRALRHFGGRPLRRNG